MKKYILLFLLAATTTLLTAQDFDEIHPCGTHLIQPAQSSWVGDQSVLQTTTSNTEKIIPVVFHIFHESGLENISRENVLLALERLNKDFDKNHENLPQTPAVFKNIAADVDVRFVLATKDPQGNCTDGINRYFDPALAGMQHVPGNSFTTYQWDYKKYLNIFVVKSFIWKANDIANYFSASDGAATFPNGDLYGLNGIYLSHKWFLFTQNGNFANETITHEAGHWLNLWHTWGPNNNFPGNAQNCNDSDEVSDTPNQEGPTPAKCLQDFPFISCNNGPNGNMFCNYMDCCQDQPKGCHTMFTNGQKDRMQNALNNTFNRQNLWTDVNLNATGVNQWTPTFSCPTKPKADFGTNLSYEYIHCMPDISMTFQERCFKGKVDSLRWLFPGGTPSTATSNEVTVSYPNPGLYFVTLIAKNAFGSDTLKRSYTVKAIDETPYPAGNGFENFENTNAVSNVGAVFQFTGGINNDFRIAFVGYNSSRSLECGMGLDKYYRIRFVTKKFTIGIQDSIFSFHLSHRGEEDAKPRNKGIRVVASYNCRDISTEQSIGLLINDELETTTVGNPNANYVPTSPNQWKEINFIIPPQFRGRNDVQFQFNYTADQTNNLYIDNIRAKSSIMTPTAEPENSFDWNIFPNPTDNELTIEFKQIGNPMSFNVFDINGRLMFTEQVSGNNQRISVSNLLPAGFYTCKLVNDKGVPIGETKKLIKY